MRVFKRSKDGIVNAAGADPKQLVEDVRGGVLAIGNFDGVHKGHKALLERAMAQAAQLDVLAGVMVFEPHPREVFQPQIPHFRLTPLAEKLRLFADIGVDFTVVLDFDAALASLSADDFIAKILIGELGVAHVVVGYDFNFGNRRSGSAETLVRAGRDNGFDVSVVSAQGDGETRYSSSAIRTELAQGRIKSATDALGHYWQIVGRVIGGQKLGRELGFPTANLSVGPGVQLAHGIYAVRVAVGGRDYDGAAYFGARPTVEADGDVQLEVFLLDFEGDLYEQEIGLTFVAHLRDDQAFGDLEGLKAQMALDCTAARQALRSAGL